MTQITTEELYNDFNEQFPLENLKDITLDQYTNLDKTSFCYWLEAKTEALGSIWGGSSYKFGIYKRDNTIKVDTRLAYKSNGVYSWVGKYGNTAQEVFEKIRFIIYEIATAANEGRYEEIDSKDFDLGNAYKWKIAYLYSRKNLIGIFRPENLRTAAEIKGMEQTRKKSISEIHQFLMRKKSDTQTIFEYSNELWAESIKHHKKRYWLYAPGEGANMWDEFYQEGIMALGWAEIEDLNQFKSKKAIATALNEAYSPDNESNKKNSSAALYDFCHRMQEGDIVFVKEGKKKLKGYGIVDSEYNFDKTCAGYVHRRKVNWEKKGDWEIPVNVIKTLTDITSKNYCNNFINLFNLNDSNNLTDTNMKLHIALNTILCGPPGTGKTYRLQHEYAAIFTDENHKLSKDEYITDLIKDLNWWDVIALVLCDVDKAKIKDIENHHFIKIKSRFANNNTINRTIARNIQEHAKEGHTNIAVRLEPFVCIKGENYFWSIDRELVEENMPKVIDILNKINNFEEEVKVVKRYEFITFHQKYSYEDFMVGITPVLDDDNESHLKFEKKYGIFYNCCEEAIRLAGFESFDDCLNKSPEERHEMFDQAKPYAIFIDEINRANISAVFGELISCIEDDKRLGAGNELWVKLPLNGGMFGVPKNLYIVGTMNTADRSIALIDVALRRRFEFDRMYPIYTNIPEWSSVLLKELNGKIFELKKSADFLIGHSFFIGKEESEKNKIFDNKIIPLLYEYFQNNSATVKNVLESAGLSVKDENHILRLQ